MLQTTPSATMLRRASRLLALSLLAGIVSLFSLTAFAAGERHALVIGNSNYAGQALDNPVNDANDMAVQLQKMGYKIHGGGPALDLDRIGMERTIRNFAGQLPKDAHALFYYAGHGMANKEDNYLIPIKHNLEFQEQLQDRSVGLRSIVNILKTANPDGINVVLLDACRDNPLSRSFRSASKGLDRLQDFPLGVFIGYAADSGQVAEDGVGRNGTYTGELLSVMREQPNVIIEIAHKEVAQRVYQKTAGSQFPVSETKVYGNWCFGQCSEPDPIVIPHDPVEKKSTNRWMIAGGIAAAALLVGLAASKGESSDGGDTGTNFTLTLTPP